MYLGRDETSFVRVTTNNVFSQATVNFIVCLLFIINFQFLVRSPRDGELLGLEWQIIRQVLLSNTIFPDQNSGVRCQYSKGSDTI